jgi:hypothetical protein
MRNDHIGLLNRFAVRRDQKVMEPAGGQSTPAIFVLVVKLPQPLSLMFEEMITIASYIIKHCFIKLTPSSDIGILITKAGKILKYLVNTPLLINFLVI